jgi:dCMP deaminase
MIIGVTGFFCSGKDTFANFLQRRSFYHISLSDMIREEIGRRRLEVTHERTVEIGNELRHRFGPQVLAEMALAQMDPTKNYVITSIRNPGEIAILRSKEDFILLFIEASPRKRFERSRERSRSGDVGTFEEFKAAEAAQMSSADPMAQQLLFCRDNADLILRNDGSVELFEKKSLEMLRKIVSDYMPPRPSWHEYFMSIAQVAATRSNCIKRRIGAIIVRDKQIVSTGYNGTPKGIKNCDEGGCPRCWNFGESGSGLSECICVHAEENAIVQAACNGISIQGSTLYSTLCPCSYCAKSIINAGIKCVVYRDPYGLDEISKRMFKQAGVELIALERVPPRSIERFGLATSSRSRKR